MLFPCADKNRSTIAAKIGSRVRSAFTFLRTAAAALAMAAYSMAGAAAPTPNYVILYSDSGAMYRPVFDEIMAGIDERTRTTSRKIAVAANSELDPLQLVKKNGSDVVIALGRQAVTTAMSMDKDVPIVIGAVINPPASPARPFSGISLATDPAILFTKLKAIYPSARRVHAVYAADQNEWLIRLARDAAKLHGLELMATPVRNLSMAAKAYETAFSVIDSKTDAIWIPQDSFASESATIVPKVLQDAWARNIVVFGSAYPLLERGVLFAPYPDNAKLGANLAEIAMGLANNESRKPSFTLLKDVRVLFNQRTASHLGIRSDVLQKEAVISID